MTIKELRAKLDKMEQETGTDSTEVQYRESDVGFTYDINWCYTETIEDGRTFVILHS